jgi:hypothetical protein
MGTDTRNPIYLAGQQQLRYVTFRRDVLPAAGARFPSDFFEHRAEEMPRWDVGPNGRTTRIQRKSLNRGLERRKYLLV